MKIFSPIFSGSTKTESTFKTSLSNELTSSLDAYYLREANWDNLVNLPSNILSSSAQIAQDISGSFTQTSSSLSTRVENLESFSSSLNNTFATDSELTSVSSSLATDLTGLDGRVDTLEGKTLLSSSTQIASDISGAFTSTSSSLASDITSLDGRLDTLDNKTLISGSTQIAGEISGAFTSTSSSLASDLTSLDGRLDTLESKTLVSSSAQIATEISGAFTSTSSSIATDLTSLDGRLDTLESKTLVSSSSQIILQDTTGNLSGSRIDGLVLSASYAITASNALLFDGYPSSHYAVTGSNTFSGSQTIDGGLNVSGSFTASGFNFPTTDGLFGVEVLTTNGAGTLSLEIPETLYEEVKNNDIVTLPKGIPVKVVGSVGNQSLVVKADAGNPALMPASYVLAQDLAPQAEGLGLVLGKITGVNTAGLTPGKEVYVAVGGGYTQARPTGSAEVQPLGFPVKIESNGGSGVIMNPGVSNGLPNLPTGYIWVGNSGSVPVTYPTSSFAKVGENNTFTGTQTFNNLVVNGTGSFSYIESVTGSAKVIGDAFLILNNNSPAEPFAGIKVIDSGSTNVTASLIWDGVNNHWIYENVSGSTYGASGFIAGPKSTDINNILYPTQYKVVRSQGGDHIYDSNITDNDNLVSISIPLSVTGNITSSTIIKAIGGFEGNVTGNASTATTASYVEYSNVGNKPTLLSSSAQIASEISGAFTSTSSSIAGDITGLDGRLDTLEGKTLLSSSTQIASDISGAFTIISGGLSTRITDLESFSSSLDNVYATDSQLTSVSSSLASSITSVSSSLSTLQSKTLLSSSAQIASDISGSFTSTSSSLASDITGLDGRLDTLEGKTLFSSSIQVNYPDISNIPSGIVSSSNQLTGATLVNIVGSGSFSGSFQGDGSNLTGVVSTLETSTLYPQTFTSTGSITVIHNLNTEYPLVQVYDENNEIFVPEIVKVVNKDTVKVTFSELTTGKVVVAKGGHLISGSIYTGSLEWNIITNKPVGLVSGSAQLASDISGSFVSTSSSLASDITGLDGRLDTLEGKTLFSSSVQVQLNQLSGTTFSSSNFTFPENLTVQGTLTAEKYITEYISSSIIYESGSTKFGDTSDDIHQFTGSLRVLGSITGSLLGEASAVEFNNILNRPTLVSSSSQISYTGLNNIPVGILSSSNQIEADISGAFTSVSSSLAGRVTVFESATLISSSNQLSGSSIQGRFTGSFKGDGTEITGIVSSSYALTASYALNAGAGAGFPFTGDAVITGSLLVTGPITASAFSGDGSGLTNINVDVAEIATIAQSFTSTGSITVGHNLETTSPIVQLYDQNDEQFVPQTIKIIDNNTVKVTFSTTRTGKVVIAKGGHIVNSYNTHTSTFTSTGSITVTHNLGTTSPLVQAYNSVDEQFIPQTIKIEDSNTVKVTFSTPTAGKIVVGRGGHLITGSVLWSNVLNTPSGLVSGSSQLNNSTLSGMTVSGSFSGSFQGDGSGLTNTGINTSELYAHTFLLMGG